MYIQGLAAVKRKAEGVAKGKAKKPKVEPGVSTKKEEEEEDDPPADCAEDHMLKMLVINASFFSTRYPTKIQDWNEEGDDPYGDDPNDMQ